MPVMLKDRNRQIPGGYRFLVAETNWDSTVAVGKFASLSRITNGLIQHRLGNAHLTNKHNWATNYQVVENEVAAYNAQLCLAHGHTEFITSDVPIPKWTPPQPPHGVGERVAGALKKTSSGIKLVSDWLGEGLKPVEKELAEKRAFVCAVEQRPGMDEKGNPLKPGCPKNQLGNFWQKLQGHAAQNLKTLIAIKNDMALSTSRDAELHFCAACDCKLDVKVWSPLDLILKNTSPEVMANLDPQCWILKRDQ